MGLFYYAGHGMQIEQRNFLIPIGAEIFDAGEVEFEAVDAQRVVNMMTNAGSRVSIVILDACRNNPFRSYFRSSNGLAVMHAPRGTIISFATAPGKKSSDGGGRNGLYTAHLLSAIQTPGLTIEEVFKQTATAVEKKSGGIQWPWRSSSLTGKDFCFTACRQSHQSYRPQGPDVSELLRTCKRHFNADRLTTGRGGTALVCYEDVLKKDPTNAEALAGLENIEAKYVGWIESFINRGQPQKAQRYLASLRKVNPESPKLVELEERMQPSSVVSASQVSSLPFTQNNAFQGGKVFRDRLQDGSFGPEMVGIPAGSFRMGDLQGEGRDNEKPVHRVSVARFAMGKYEVTFAEYDKFAEATGRAKPSDQGWGRGNRPVINVPWHDATAYAAWLTQQTGHTYRLPTEAEWEYAARAGTTTKYWWGNQWVSGKASCDYQKYNKKYNKTTPVGSFDPNPFGLYDTVGNVWEWCADPWHKNYEGAPTDGSVWDKHGGNARLIRGGSFRYIPLNCRTANRSRVSSGKRGRDGGVRLARR
ncbi:MAG: hypothetical protein DRR19_02225 [Candidatus Parabeggiatoa sp. nov. 1]|nr:MAG: hypothetical protein DRR19_02225 [Gammaproteobacteria bacterium]